MRLFTSRSLLPRVVTLVLASSLGARMAVAESPIPSPVRSVDLLIVVDTSPGAAPTRAAFAANIPDFVEQLTQAFPGDFAASLDLQVGVITATPADLGELRMTAVATCAAAPDGRFVRYAADQWGNIATNYSGTLAASIQCLLPVDAVGPAAAQPMAMMSVALDGSVLANTGFLRPNATLAILVVTNQDDCSGSEMTPFGCAQEAWTCTPTLDATPGARTGCVANPSPANLLSIDAAVTDLASRKPNLERIAFGAIRGPEAPVAVTIGPAIAPSCDNVGVTATPGLRVDAIAARFPHHWAVSACDPSAYSGFVGAIVSATYPATTGERDGVCDGGFPGDDADVASHGDEPGVGGCGCKAGTPATGTGAIMALALAMMLRRRRAA